jgi:UbiD family decarboxylase
VGYGNLRQWIEQLRRDKDLAVIDAPVDPNLELAEIHRRVNKAFGTRPEQLVKSMTAAIEMMIPPSASGLWREKGLLLDLIRAGTKNIYGYSRLHRPSVESWQ